jgi:hypothetical protein
MYSKPMLEKFGSLRELTELGAGADCDGGLFGSGIADGSTLLCNSNSRS